jgi:hypothetical protein
MVPKCGLQDNIPLHIQEVNYEIDIYEPKDRVGEKTLSPNLPLKLGPAKKILS